MPATMLVTFWPPAGTGDGSGTAATPMSSGFMPSWASEPDAACQITIEVLPVAKSLSASVALEYSASLGLTILLLCMKSMYCLIAATFWGVLKVGFPAASKKLPPCCWLRVNAECTFSLTLPHSRDRPQCCDVVSSLASATNSVQVVGG